MDLVNGEHRKEPYISLNPEHTVPTLVDGDFVIWESHAICTYLVDKYGKDDSLYPKDLQIRARCNQRLFFDTASLFPNLRSCSLHVFFMGGTEIPKDKVDPMYVSFDLLEVFLKSDKFLVGDNLTIADICAALTVLLLVVYAPLSADKYPNILGWLSRVSETIPFFDELNAKYSEVYRQLVQVTIEKNKQK